MLLDDGLEVLDAVDVGDCELVVIDNLLLELAARLALEVGLLLRRPQPSDRVPRLVAQPRALGLGLGLEIVELLLLLLNGPLEFVNHALELGNLLIRRHAQRLVLLVRLLVHLLQLHLRRHLIEREQRARA